MLGSKRILTGRTGNLPSTKTRLHLEPLEDRCMPSVAAPWLTATAASGTQVNLGWNSVAGANGYLVDEWINGAWRQMANFGSGTTGCSVTGLSPNTTYYFDVGAYDWSGVSWASSQSATTIPSAPPAAPSFTAGASGTQVGLRWNSVADANGYLVDEWVNGAWRQMANFGSGTTSCSITGLSPNTTYSFDVGAYNAYGTTWATYQSVTTSGMTLTFDHPSGGAAYTPVSGALFGANGPSYLDVQQGAVGDCWLLASLAEVAARAPQDIRNMFTYNGTATENGAVVGVYTVRLFDTSGVSHNITVDTELPGGGNYYDHVSNGVLWVALAEKAYAQANGAGFVTSRFVGSDSYDALNGGFGSWALQAITGLPAGEFSINPANIGAAWNAGQFIVLGSSSTATSPYIVGGSDGTHAYAVVGYNPSSSTPFQVYNPWGTSSSGWALGLYHGHQVYGLFTASGGFLSQNFASQAISAGAEKETPYTFSRINCDLASPSFGLVAESATASTFSTAKPTMETSVAEARVSSSQTGFAMHRSPGHAIVDAIYAEASDFEFGADLLWQS
jgi:hypothetical protein